MSDTTTATTAAPVAAPAAAPAATPATATGPVTTINSLAEFREIVNGDEPAIVDFWAPWCGPCKIISPIFERMAENTKGMKFYKVDTDAQQDVMHEAGIRAMPTFAVYQKGEKKGQVLGARPQMMMELIQKYRDLDTK